MQQQTPEQRNLRRNWHILNSRVFYEGYRIPRFAYRIAKHVKARHPQQSKTLRRNHKS